ncbi:effector-associated constant component EACC1 [Streptomyces swartbergensis]|uniref:effector-associated constant component EACC1 n=1 Tax=Streptomyces swartbergensis TaxID=487165 RepID=UPI003802350E
MSIRIDVAGDDTALADLWDWLGDERDLRRRLRLESAPVRPGTMGSGTEIVMQAAGLGLDVVNTVIAAVAAWLAYRQRQPRAVPTVTFTAPDGTSFTLTDDDPAKLAQTAAELYERLPRDDDPAA